MSSGADHEMPEATAAAVRAALDSAKQLRQPSAGTGGFGYIGWTGNENP